MSLSTIHPALQAGQTAVITGGASGIGLAAAMRFAAGGMRVCIADADPQALDRAAKALTDEGAEVLALTVDVAAPEDVDRLAEAAFARFGQVSVLMNNAAAFGGGDVFGDPGRWRRLIDVNVLGVLNGIQRFGPPMIAQGAPGLIINTGSKQGVTNPPGDTAYNVAKAAVKAMTEGLAHTLRNTQDCQITAHLLIPGFTYTGVMAARIPEKPPGAWTPGQVIDRMLEGLARGEFYLLCQDNETTRQQDERRIAWGAGDIIYDRPALSRWHPDYKAAFEAFMRSGET